MTERKIEHNRMLALSLDISALPALLNTRRPSILEIGANDGGHSRQFLQAVPDARLYCFEPDLRAIAQWRHRMANSPAKLFEIAVGSQNGFVDFYESEERKDPNGTREWHKSGSIRVPAKHLKRYPDVAFRKTPRSVRTETLDSWAEENGVNAVDLIWADVQGAEGDLIDGARMLLRKTRFFYTEYSNDQLYAGQLTLAKIAQRLPTGFLLLAQYPQDALFINRQTE